MTQLTLVALVCACYVAVALGAGHSYYTAYYNPLTHQYDVKNVKDATNGVAVAEFVDNRYKTGWARFNMETSREYADSVQAYGGGFVEGYVTADLMWDFWQNQLINQFKGHEPKTLLLWLDNNAKWVEQQVNKHDGDAYWTQVGLTLDQAKGLAGGYNAKYPNSTRELTYAHILLLNANGDLETLSGVVPDAKDTPGLLETFKNRGAHCSALIKVKDDMSELYAGHTTWDIYYSMVRVFKQITFNFRAPMTTAKTSLFSSYPGFISSVDDFYQTSSNLVVIETTNGCFNKTLLDKYVVEESVLSWLRVVVSNRMARNGKEWIEIFSRENSGTYNNQWIIVDYNKFVPYQPLEAGTLHIAEQIPGKVYSADVTKLLRLGYWPSFNIPYFEENYKVCGFDKMRETYGGWETLSMSPRGQIFRRNANEVESIYDHRDLLRYNDWEHDPLSAGNPGNQISSRFDLVPENAHPSNPYLVRNAFGGIDSKSTSNALVNVGKCYAQSGPTLGGKTKNVPAFDWKDWEDVSHIGMPDVFDFDWIMMPDGSVSA